MSQQDQYDIALQAQQKADMDTFLHEVSEAMTGGRVEFKTRGHTHTQLVGGFNPSENNDLMGLYSDSMGYYIMGYTLW